MSDSVRLSRVSTVILRVRDLDRSLSFYRDSLGLSVRVAFEGFAFLDAGTITLALNRSAAAPEVDASLTEVVFEVQDIQAAYRELGRRGVAFTREPRAVTADLYATDFRDPDGHVLSITGPARKTEP